MQKNTYGKVGEIIATNYLKQKGYKIIANNYKNPIGEIDIIAQDKNYLVFVEVKTRISRAFGDPAEAVNYFKQQKIRQVATMYLKQHNLLQTNCRFDVVAILGQNGDEDVRHIENAFWWGCYEMVKTCAVNNVRVDWLFAYTNFGLVWGWCFCLAWHINFCLVANFDNISNSVGMLFKQKYQQKKLKGI